MNKNRRVITTLFILLAFVLIGCAQGEAVEPAAEEDVEVPSMVAESVEGDVEISAVEAEPTEIPILTILADGQIRNGKPALPLSFETSGKLLAINVEVGDTVTAGDVLATLDDEALQDNLRSAELRVQSAENSLLQSQGELQRLVTWEPDDSAVAIAEANITSAQSSLDSARTQDAAAGSSLTSVNVQISQAERELASAQEMYDNAFSPGREWEVQYNEIVCENIGGMQQCLGVTYAERIKNDREAATNRLQNAKEQLQVARSNYAVEAARISGVSAVGAEAQLVAAQEELNRALKGPTDAEIAAAQLNVSNAELALEQEQFALDQAQEALDQAQLLAPWSGTVLSVDVAQGGMIGVGSPIITLVDESGLEFITTNLSERDLNQVTAGQDALITLKTYPNSPIEGKVARVELIANGTVGDAAIFPVVIELNGSDLTIRQGMTGRVEILQDN
ncbi:MAG: HlyD family efflux transporter periplasmic adaptor subunit [Chloroflexota bacterium]